MLIVVIPLIAPAVVISRALELRAKVPVSLPMAVAAVPVRLMLVAPRTVVVELALPMPMAVVLAVPRLMVPAPVVLSVKVPVPLA